MGKYISFHHVRPKSDKNWDTLRKQKQHRNRNQIKDKQKQEDNVLLNNA